jgi:hypothetical protein
VQSLVDGRYVAARPGQEAAQAVRLQICRTDDHRRDDEETDEHL